MIGCRRKLHTYKVNPKIRGCPYCRKIARRNYQQKHKDKWRLWSKKNYNKNPDYKKSWAKNNPENLRKTKVKYRQNNKDKVNADCSKRRAKKLNATPSWLTKEHYREMRAIYSLAKELQWLSNETLEVDHEIPLQGEIVCGLHVPWNLQILPKSINCRKHNKIVLTNTYLSAKLKK